MGSCRPQRVHSGAGHTWPGPRHTSQGGADGPGCGCRDPPPGEGRLGWERGVPVQAWLWACSVGPRWRSWGRQLFSLAVQPGRPKPLGRGCWPVPVGSGLAPGATWGGVRCAVLGTRVPLAWRGPLPVRGWGLLPGLPALTPVLPVPGSRVLLSLSAGIPACIFSPCPQIGNSGSGAGTSCMTVFFTVL